MKKFFLALIAITVISCSDNSTEPQNVAYKYINESMFSYDISTSFEDETIYINALTSKLYLEYSMNIEVSVTNNYSSVLSEGGISAGSYESLINYITLHEFIVEDADQKRLWVRGVSFEDELVFELEVLL